MKLNSEQAKIAAVIDDAMGEWIGAFDGTPESQMQALKWLADVREHPDRDQSLHGLFARMFDLPLALRNRLIFTLWQYYREENMNK